MPELPEVETTTRGLRKTILNLTIKDVWTDLATKDKRQHDAVANPKYFVSFKKEVVNKKIKSVERQAKNILINLSDNKTILIHMKMTGHLLYNNRDKYVHVLFTLSNGKYLAFSDIRKFGKITLLNTKTAYDSRHLKDIGPEPLDKNFTLKDFIARLNRKPNGKIKTVLMDQSVIAGIGNIYSDEILWKAGIHPERKVSKIKEQEFKEVFKAMQKILIKSIKLGGDSMSDYINLSGGKGKFQLYHEAYKRKGKKCRKKGCKGIIKRKMINGRSAHFCLIHQK
ncbi:DNA-formamidopyrimidine glycosylase [Candidatus Nomurabacteria bacterium RIFCSPHIGHO2_02_FULL_35_13]|uniref:DNA-formamidopyrimidine glycosylase n=2 Tax=Candidatus Nomuraibacteriota TaxID=1752729 RepID=A0A1F6VNT1_9BACT|nr:MAG: Formamidopyrimidine-DNA glycosylase [Candidatus Nomurabacteria bacterium GW2011_GWA1_35_8]OGI71337.1 MAG: DNA-formamidopyrimidine glycosylase [Candidatus Nomurabacteria bacterium RIFCSPHIGHO2_02_FULL_35_13]